MQTESKNYSVISNSLRPHRLYSPRNSPTRILEGVAFPFSRWSSQPRDWTHVSRIAGDSSAESLGKPKNTGVGSLSLLQQVFLTQELNWGLLNCRQILYQLSYQGSLEMQKSWQIASPHSSLGTLSYLIPWICLLLPLYNHKGFDLGHTWMV